MGTRNKKKINVERVGNSGHPITTNPTPVRHVMFQDKIPYTTFSNGTVVQSTVNKDGVNEQILRKSNLNPAYKLEVKYDGVSTPDTLGLYRANHPSDLWAYDKIKPGTKEYKEAVEKFNLYGIPLATYGEAYDNLKEVERQVDGLQEGGEIPSNTAVSFLENLPYGRHNVDKHNKLVEMGKRFGNAIPGSVKPVPLPSKYQPAVPPVKMPMHQQDTSDIKPAPMPMYPGQSTNRMPVHKDDKFVIPQEMYQEGGNLPSDDQQQQFFIAIITDMAKTLGVEPSQELAEAVMAAFENNDDSQGLLTLFTKTKDKFMNETGLFREGGKMNAFIEKFKCGGKKKVKKAALGDQIGGKISKVSRSTMFDDAKEFMPEADRKFVRTAYKTAKNHGRDLGLTGKGLRNWAKGQVSDRFRDYANEQMTQHVPQLPVLSDDVVIEDEPIAFDDPFKNVDFSTPVVKPIEMRPKPAATNVSVGQGTNTYTVQRGDTISQIVANYNKNNPNANLKWQDVARWNGISDPTKMQIGHNISFSDPGSNTPTTTNAGTPTTTPVSPVTQSTPVAPTTPTTQPVEPTAPTTQTTPSAKFDIERYAKQRGAFNTDLNIYNHGGKRYVRHDPTGSGDFLIGEDGNIYKAGRWGSLGEKVTDANMGYKGSDHYVNYQKVLEAVNEFKRSQK